MSNDAVGWVFRESPYTGNALVLHLALADVANDLNDWALWLPLEAMAKKTRMSRSTVKRALTRMIDDGYLDHLDDESARAHRVAAHLPLRYRLKVGISTGQSEPSVGRPTGQNEPSPTGQNEPANRATTSRATTKVKPPAPSVREHESANSETARELLNNELQRRKSRGEAAPATKWIACAKVIEKLLDAGHKPAAIAAAMPSIGAWTINSFEFAIAKRRPTKPKRDEGIDQHRDVAAGELKL